MTRRNSATAPAPNIPREELVSLSPYVIKKIYWPDVYFYRKQRYVIDAVFDETSEASADEVVVPGANEAGKDFVLGFICNTFFITRHPCRVVTTSAGEDHLAVLWGEIGRFIDKAKHPLNVKQGGPLLVNDLHIRKLVDGKVCRISYIKGMVANDENVEKMQGHHATPDDPNDARDGIPRTLFACDESSGVRNVYKRMADGWAKKQVIVGNCWECTGNTGKFFHDAIEGDPAPGGLPGGDLPRVPGHPEHGYIRRVIRIAAEDIPNVAYGLQERRAGKIPSNKILVPGVKAFKTYETNLRKWDPEQICVSLRAMFYKGKKILLWPPEWLANCKILAHELGKAGIGRATAIGIDPGEGTAETVMVAGNRRGVVAVEALKTPDTSDINDNLIDFGRRMGVPPEDWIFDAGGGGKQHADRLRRLEISEERPYAGVRTLPFGGAAGQRQLKVEGELTGRVEDEEVRYVYFNRRAELYGEASILCDPDLGGYAIPAQFAELHRQLSLIPKKRDEHGRLKLPPKNRTASSTSKEQTITDIVGCSPDHADAFCLMVYGVQHPSNIVEIGAMV